MADKKETNDAKEVKKTASETTAKTTAKKATAAKPTTAKATPVKATAAKPSTAKAAPAKKAPAKAETGEKTTATKSTAVKKPATAKSTTTKSTVKAETAEKATPAKKPAATAKSTTAKTTATKSTTAKKPAVKKPEQVAEVEPVKTEVVTETPPVVNTEETVQAAPVIAEEVVPETVQKTETAEEVALVETAPQEAAKPSFIQKTKSVFVNGGNKVKNTVKGWFAKEQPVAVTAEGGDPTTNEMKTILAGSNLSKKERFIRFMRSQSGWLFVLPAVILMCIFTLYPIFNAFIRAFMENYQPTNKRNPYDGWGFENFVRVLKGDTGMGGANFWQCLLNTFIVTIVSVPLSILVALLIAVALNSIKAVRSAYQTVLFLPYLTNALAMGAVFATFFNIIGTPSGGQSVGIVNNILGWFGVEPIEWLDPPSHAWGAEDATVKFYWASYTAAIIYDVWSGLPFKILILFSSLQSVNKQYYDAAKVDGASKSKILWKITAPMISPMLSYLFITGIMGGMKSYSSIIGLFGETMGRDYSMGTVVGYIYQYIGRGQMGYAFAGSLLLFFIIMVITAISNLISRRRVTYT